MADCEDMPTVTDKPRKRKITGREREKCKKQKLSSHVTGDDCGCKRLKCFEAVDEENRSRLIKEFNGFETKDSQDSYLASLITVTEIERNRPRNENPTSSNSNSYRYKVFVMCGTSDCFVDVCFQAFLSLFGIKKGRLETIKKSLATTGLPPIDHRGQHSNRPHKHPEDLLDRVIRHISSFRGRQSHYSLKKTRRIYLPEDLNVNKMFLIYKEKYPDDKLSYESYRNTFNTEFNISFGYPRSDTCSVCDKLVVAFEKIEKQLEDKETSEMELLELRKTLSTLKTEHELHNRKADTFYRRKRDAKARAKRDGSLEAFTFDYQKNLNLPNQSTGDFYYRRKLSFLSFNIHQLSTDDVFIYAYDETVANKGSDEVASFLHHHFTNNLSDSVRDLELFCDSCAGQNKNYTIIRLLHYFVHVMERFDSIKLTFPERGHSYMECDRDMALIKTQSPVSVPSEWMDIFRAARHKPSPFHVVEVTKEMVKNFARFLQPKYKLGCPVPSRPLRELFFRKEDDPRVFAHRDSWNGLIFKTDIVSLTRTKNSVSRGQSELQQLYKERLCISTAKFKDLQVLKTFSKNQEFFTSLPHQDCPSRHNLDEEVTPVRVVKET